MECLQRVLPEITARSCWPSLIRGIVDTALPKPDGRTFVRAWHHARRTRERVAATWGILEVLRTFFIPAPISERSQIKIGIASGYERSH